MTATFYVGDAIEVMNKLPEKSVDLVLTSPPFLALRSYLPTDHPDKALEGGSQATPGAYIDWLVDVVEACDRVLAPHGSLCIELGDTYAGTGGAGGDWSDSPLTTKARVAGGSDGGPTRRIKSEAWPLAKSLSLIPELFRFTLVYGINPLTGRTTERWRLRNVVRWVRPNPPVGALGDKFRPATSELMVFCKSAKRYFDLDAVREPHKPNHGTLGKLRGGPKADSAEHEFAGKRLGPRIEYPAGAPPLDWWNIPPGGYEGAHYAVFPPELCIKPIKAMSPERVCRQCGEPSRRIVKSENATDERQALADYLRSQREAAGVTVKELAAYFPSVSGGMTGCVWNWENAANVPTAEQWPVLKERLGLSDEFDDLVLGDRRWTEDPAVYVGGVLKPRIVGDFMGSGSAGKVDGGITRISQTLGWSDCGHNDWRPGVVLDPFVGSGTTLMVATGHGRDAIGIDLDSRNFELALERVGPFILERAL